MMQQPAKNSLSILGIIIAMVSLWLSWITFHQVPIESALPYIALLSTAIASATLMIPNTPQTQKTTEVKDG